MGQPELWTPKPLDRRQEQPDPVLREQVRNWIQTASAFLAETQTGRPPCEEEQQRPAQRFQLRWKAHSPRIDRYLENRVFQRGFWALPYVTSSLSENCGFREPKLQ